VNIRIQKNYSMEDFMKYYHDNLEGLHCFFPETDEEYFFISELVDIEVYRMDYFTFYIPDDEVSLEYVEELKKLLEVTP